MRMRRCLFHLIRWQLLRIRRDLHDKEIGDGIITNQPMSSHVSRDDQPFEHFSLQHRLVAWVSENLFDHVTYTVRRGLLRGMKRKGGLGWIPGADTFNQEQLFWKNLDLTGLTVYDVGAFHGLLTMLFARKAKQVVSYEPNTRNRARLEENLRLNGLRNVRVRKFGLGAEPADLAMAFHSLMPGGATVDQQVVGQLTKAHPSIRTERVRITTLDAEVFQEKLPPPDFIKIDIEGLELEALRGGRQTLLTYKPALFLEMHGETMNLKKRNVSQIVRYLMESGYENIEHIETGARINEENSAVAAQGHLYCRCDR